MRSVRTSTAIQDSRQGFCRAVVFFPVPPEAVGTLFPMVAHGVWSTLLTLPCVCNHNNYCSDTFSMLHKVYHSHFRKAEIETRSANKLKRQILHFSSFHIFGSFSWSTIWNQETPNGKDSLRWGSSSRPSSLHFPRGSCPDSLHSLALQRVSDISLPEYAWVRDTASRVPSSCHMAAEGARLSCKQIMQL